MTKAAVEMSGANTSKRQSRRNLAVVTPYVPSLTETFIRAHIEQLPANTTLIHGWRPSVGAQTLLSFPKRVGFKLLRTVSGESLDREMTAAYVQGFRQYKTNAVLAEYGESGVQVMGATQQTNLPLIVHFHGYDASVTSVLEEHRLTYPKMFQAAAAVVAVSRAMQSKLIALGAPAKKVHYNPYGVDSEKFRGASPGLAPPIFLAVGRFTEKKAPDKTLLAFTEVLKEFPDARLRMLGEGPLLEDAKRLVTALDIHHAVSLLGAQDHATVEREMRGARCFVQHSIVAPSGDCEGTPVSIIEAGATGLPVVSTRHAGIPDVVIEGQTGFLVDEGDVAGMAKHMKLLAKDPGLAGEIGAQARSHIKSEFNREKRLGNLWEIIESCIRAEQTP